MIRIETRTVALALALAVLAAPARAVHIGQPEADVSAQLVDASRKLFGESVGASPVVTRVGGLERFSEGYDYDVYEVRGGAGAPAKLIRLQVHPDATSQIDLAIRYEGGRIAGVVPLRDVIFEGKPFAALPQLFAALAKRPVRAYARPLSRFFEGLELLEEGAAGPRPAPSAGPAGMPPFLAAKQPLLGPGEAMPAWTGKALSGETLGRDALAGRPAMILFGDLRKARMHEALAGCAAQSRKYPGVAFVAAVSDTAAEAVPLLQRQSMGYLAGRTVADVDLAVARAFKIPATPCVVFFDAQGKLAARVFYAGQASVELHLRALAGAPAAAAAPASGLLEIPPGIPGVAPQAAPTPAPVSPVKRSILSRSKKERR